MGQSSFLNNIKKYRKLAGLSQTDAAIVLGVVQTAVSKIELGIVSPRVEQLQILANAYGVNVSDFFGIDVDQEEENT